MRKRRKKSKSKCNAREREEKARERDEGTDKEITQHPDCRALLKHLKVQV